MRFEKYNLQFLTTAFRSILSIVLPSPPYMCLLYSVCTALSETRRITNTTTTTTNTTTTTTTTTTIYRQFLQRFLRRTAMMRCYFVIEKTQILFLTSFCPKWNRMQVSKYIFLNEIFLLEVSRMKHNWKPCVTGW